MFEIELNPAMFRIRLCNFFLLTSRSLSSKIKLPSLSVTSKSSQTEIDGAQPHQLWSPKDDFYLPNFSNGRKHVTLPANYVSLAQNVTFSVHKSPLLFTLELNEYILILKVGILYAVGCHNTRNLLLLLKLYVFNLLKLGFVPNTLLETIMINSIPVEY